MPLERGLVDGLPPLKALDGFTLRRQRFVNVERHEFLALVAGG
jgi:hypothetical protein